MNDMKNVSTRLFYFIFIFLAAPCGMRDLSSLTTVQTHAPCSGITGALTTGLPGNPLVILNEQTELILKTKITKHIFPS